MKLTALQTRILTPPKGDLFAVLDEALPNVEERNVLVISSKVVAISQGRCELIPQGGRSKRRAARDAIAKREAACYLEREKEYPHTRLFTVYEGVLGSSVGTDESNGNGYFILPPKNCAKAVAEIRSYIKCTKGISELGVIISDARGRPMRNGATAISLAHAGFEALYDYRKQKDIFGVTMKNERLNLADSIAAAANIVMGEGNERTPLALCSDIPRIVFTEETTTDLFLSPEVKMEDDVFAQFFMPKPWQKKGGYEV